MLLKLDHITKRFGATLVLDGVSLTLNAGERIGIVGANGAGKSTLLTIAAGHLPCNSGHITHAPTAEVGYVPQMVVPHPGETIATLLAASRRRLAALEQQMHTLAAQMAAASGSEQARLIAAYGEVAARFEQSGGYDLDYRIGMVLDGMRLSHLAHERPLATLSGGEKTRVALAALLLRTPDVLLLDEPTNHLDAPTAAWLEAYLVQQPGAALIVSHDRHFLEQVATQIAHLDEHTHQVRLYGGNYHSYLQQQQRERHAWEEAYSRQQAEIAHLQQQRAATPRRFSVRSKPRDGDKLSYNFHGQRVQSTISRTVRNAEQRLQRISADPIPRPPEALQFRATFVAAAPPGGVLLHTEHISKAFDGKPVLQNISLAVRAQERVVLVGENGSGKTTLLRILAGELAPDAGRVVRREALRIGYLPQEDALPTDDRTLLDAYRAGRSGYAADLRAELLASGLFHPDEVERPLRVVSVGQRRKLTLARLLVAQSHVLLLDEPTNQLSLDVVEQLEAALAVFPGAVLAISHDRRFIERFRGTCWRLSAGVLQQEHAAIAVP
jgi:macrolide transport system ATP-binding/permease protein